MNPQSILPQLQYYAYPQLQQIMVVPDQNNFLAMQQQQFIDPTQITMVQQSLQFPLLFKEQMITKPQIIQLSNQLFPLPQQQELHSFIPNFINIYTQNSIPPTTQGGIQYPECLLRQMQGNSFPNYQAADMASICTNYEFQMIPNSSQNINSVAVNLMNSQSTAGQPYLLNGLNGQQQNNTQDTQNSVNLVVYDDSNQNLNSEKCKNYHEKNSLIFPRLHRNSSSIPQTNQQQEDGIIYDKQSCQILKSESDITAIVSKDFEKSCIDKVPSFTDNQKLLQSQLLNENEQEKLQKKESAQRQSPKDCPKKQEHIQQSRNFSKNLLKSFFKYALHREAEDKRFTFNFKRYIASNKTNDNMVIKLLTTSPYRAIFKDYLGQPATEWINSSKVLNLQGQAQFLQMCRDESISDIQKRSSIKKKHILSEQEGENS